MAKVRLEIPKGMTIDVAGKQIRIWATDSGHDPRHVVNLQETFKASFSQGGLGRVYLVIEDSRSEDIADSVAAMTEVTTIITEIRNESK